MSSQNLSMTRFVPEPSTPLEVAELSRVKKCLLSPDFYASVWSERGISAEKMYICKGIGFMIHGHLVDYFNRVYGHTKILDYGNIIHDGATLFDLAIIISSGSQDKDLTDIRYAYTSRIMRCMKIPYVQS